MIGDVSQRMAGRFADCLAARMAADGADAGSTATEAGATVGKPAPLPVAAAPVGGIRLALWALVRAIGRGIARIGRALASPFRKD